MPLLWILPLALYLLTFIIVFSTWKDKHQRIAEQASALIIIPTITFVLIKPDINTFATLAMFMLSFTVLTLTFHGRMSIQRPGAQHLTLFFLCMSIGGALGGTFNGLIAPMIFNQNIEFILILWVAMVMLTGSIRDVIKNADRINIPFALLIGASLFLSINVTINKDNDVQFIIPMIIIISIFSALLAWSPRIVWALLAASMFYAKFNRLSDSETIYQERSFFATHRVMENPKEQLRTIAHGSTVHGMQSTSEELRGQALSYYHPAGPVGQALRALKPAPDARFAMIGLGAGSLAAYCRAPLTCDFFEIDPVVVKIAREYFTYLKDCGASCDVEIGDGRRLIEAKPPASYDVIFLDAYSSDSIPVHLITQQALSIYKHRLKPGGVILLHLSNQYLDLRPVLAMLVQDAGMVAMTETHSPSDEEAATFSAKSIWAAVAHDEETLRPLTADPRWLKLSPKPGEPLWTDDFSNILPVLSVGGPHSPR